MDDRTDVLARKARRLRRDGAYRKAAVAYSELTAIEPWIPRWWVLLAVSQSMQGHDDDARRSLRQALYLLRHREDAPRAATLRRLLARLDAGDSLDPRPRHGRHGDSRRSRRACPFVE